MANHPFDWNTWGRMDATSLALTIRDKDVTLPEVMSQFAEAVALQNPRLNAVVELFDDAVAEPHKSGANPD
ncbi:MAG: amidase, partial [Proteobacteria bacterium]|nr:amidase [Pseudomonadota bacterium]